MSNYLSIQPKNLSIEGNADLFTDICNKTYEYSDEFGWVTMSTNGTCQTANAEVFLLAAQFVELMDKDAYERAKDNMENQNALDYVGHAQKSRKMCNLQAMVDCASKKVVRYDGEIETGAADMLAHNLVYRYSRIMSYAYNAHSDPTVPLLLELIDLVSSGKVDPCADSKRFLAHVKEDSGDNRFYLYSIFGFPPGYGDFDLAVDSHPHGGINDVQY